MGRTDLQFRLTTLIGLVACVAVNLWLFRVGWIWGLVGLNVTKHVGVAWLCQVLGINRPANSPDSAAFIPPPHSSRTGSP